MQYRDGLKDGEKLSLLGYGCMRFPKKGNSIDMVETERQLLHAIEEGVNYFDTAYIYPGSEAALGTILSKNKIREQVKIATKLPHYLIKSMESVDKYFNTQLERLKTGYIDYYLMHMLNDVATWKRLCDMGIKEWIEQKKASGQIKKIGFSIHGNTDAFIKLIDAYDWEFCQIQYNYMDEHSQAGRKGLDYAAGKNIPVVIMEPLRGGRLTNNLPKEAIQLFTRAKSGSSPAEWAFRWLYDQPGVSVVLSGMNSMEMLCENIRIASETKLNSMTQEEFEVYEKVKKAINAGTKVNCTGCGYCMPCPRGVDIPGSFRALNVRHTDGWVSGFREYFMCTTMRSVHTNASLCTGCGKCEKHCPQSIKIRSELKSVTKTLENPVYKVARLIVKKFGHY